MISCFSCFFLSLCIHFAIPWKKRSSTTTSTSPLISTLKLSNWILTSLTSSPIEPKLISSSTLSLVHFETLFYSFSFSFVSYHLFVHISFHSLAEAVSDANKAIQLSPSLSKAYLRKGYAVHSLLDRALLNSYYLVVLLMKLNRCIYRFACIKLEEYHTAKVALEKGASFAPNESRFTNLIQECDRYIAGQHIFLCLL